MAELDKDNPEFRGLGNLDDKIWRRSSTCEGGACVEVALTSEGDVFLRDRGNSESVLTINRNQWRNFVEATKMGEFDLP